MDFVSLVKDNLWLMAVGGGGLTIPIVLRARYNNFYYKEAKVIQKLFVNRSHLLAVKNSSPIVRFDRQNSFKLIHPERCLILQGRDWEGKSTLLATFASCEFLFPYKGIVLDGRKPMVCKSFREWEININEGGSLNRALEAFREMQVFRKFCMNHIPVALREKFPFFMEYKKPFVIVDQFEELLKQFPEALSWADKLSNYQVHHGLASIIFVVNSDYAAQTLLNLNRGKRNFEVTKLIPCESLGLGDVKTHPEEIRFQKCQRNIGLYKLLKEVSDEELDEKVLGTLSRWKEDCHIPYPLKYDHSWSEDELPDTKFHAALEYVVEKNLRTATENNKEAEMVPKYSDEAIGATLAVVRAMAPQTMREATLDELIGKIEGKGIHLGYANSLAHEIKKAIGFPRDGKPREIEYIYIIYITRNDSVTTHSIPS